MRVVVRFRAGAGEFAVPVEAARGVVPATEIRPVPDAAPGVVGMLDRRDGVITVVEVLGTGELHVLLLESGDTVFGLHVEEVLGVIRLPDDAFGPAPSGRADRLIAGTLRDDDRLVLLVDVGSLADRAR